MKTITKLCAAALLASTSSAALAAAPDARIQALESQIQGLAKQLQDLKDAQQKEMDDVKAQQAQVRNEQAEAKKAIATATATKPTIANGRLAVSSADGNFTAAVRALLQFDSGAYFQSKASAGLPTTYGSDLSSGTNLRRVFLGLQGKVFGDWSYNFLYDFGGASTETPGHIIYAYLQYDGLGPFVIRAGAYAPPLNFEDQTASSDLIFFERNSPSNIQRNIAGSDAREAISVIYGTDRLFGAFSLTGNKIADGAKAVQVGSTAPAANYGEQVSVVGRLAYSPIVTDSARWVIGVNGLNVLRPSNMIPRGGASLSTVPGGTAKYSYTFSDTPEFTVDSNGTSLVSTGALPINGVSSWGVETAGNYKNFYGQAGYYAFYVDRSPVAYNNFTASGVSTPTIVTPKQDTFSAWYVQGTWVLTGESRVYNPATGSYTAPKITKPFSLKDGTWGALELAARFSNINLNSHAYDTTNLTTAWSGTNRTYTFYNTVRGGNEKIVTLGLNWYANANVRVELDYQYIDVSRLQGSPAVTSTNGVLPTVKGGQSLNTLALRLQLSL